MPEGMKDPVAVQATGSLFFNDPAGGAIAVGWIVALLAHLGAFIFGYAYPYAILLAVAMAIPFLAALVVRRAPGGPTVWAILAATLMVGGLAVGNTCGFAAAGGWWKVVERCGSLTLFAAASTSLRPGQSLSRYLGLVTVVSVVSAGAAFCAGQLGECNSKWSSIGAGNINWLMGPMAIAASCAAVWTMATWRLGRRPDIVTLISAIVLLGLTVYLALATGRRGVWLVLAAGPVVLLLVFCSQRWRRVVLLTSLVLALVGMVASMAMLGDAGAVPRGERLHYTRAAVERMGEALPWGDGGYAAVLHQVSDGEWSRHFTATGVRILSFHNELFDGLAEGGVLTGTMMLALLVMAGKALIGIQDRPLQAALATAAVGCIVVGVFDNAWSQAAASFHPALLFGLAFAASAPHATGSLIVVDWFRPALLALAGVSLVGAVTLIPVCLVRSTDPPIARAIAATTTMSPPVVSMIVSEVMPAALATRDLAALQEGLSADMGTGLALSSPWYACVMADHCGDSASEISQLVAILHANPFSVRAGQRLDELCRLHPGLAASVQQRVLVRAGYSSGTSIVIPPEPARGPLDIESAADLFASALWVIQVRGDWARAAPLIERVVARYGDVPDVAMVAVQCIIAASGCDPTPLYRHRSRLTNGLRLVDVVPLLDKADSPESARRVWPFIGTVLPQPAPDSPLAKTFARLERLRRAVTPD